MTICKGILPFWLRGRIQKWRYGSKIELPYLETHLVDHCNLNCRGCGHFSPLSPKCYADISVFTRDIKRLATLFSDIGQMRLMGGEPLLHPRVVDFAVVAREWFPRTDIHLVTNGILLKTMDGEFWKTMASNRIVISVSVYPIALDVQEISSLARDNGVATVFGNDKDTFFMGPLDLKGTHDSAQSFAKCRVLCNCPFLRDGKIYPCGRIPLAWIFENASGCRLPVSASDYIDIHAKITGYDILHFLRHSVPWCRFCNLEDVRHFSWDRSERTPKEWI